MIDAGAFVEHCEVHGHLYGTSKKQILKIQRSKKIPLLDIDVHSALKFHKAFPDSNFMVILPPSLTALKKRLVARGTEKDKTIETRLSNARAELNIAFLRKELFNYRVVNDEISLAKRTFNVLVDGLYEKELYGEDKKRETNYSPRRSPVPLPEVTQSKACQIF